MLPILALTLACPTAMDLYFVGKSSAVNNHARWKAEVMAIFPVKDRNIRTPTGAENDNAIKRIVIQVLTTFKGILYYLIKLS